MLVVDKISKSFSQKKAKSSWFNGGGDQSESLDEHSPQVGGYALREVSFDCPQGQVLALLGPNGAGKTTLLKIISSLLKPDSGDIYLNEQCLTRSIKLAKQKVGFLSCNSGLYQRLTAQENIEYVGRLQGLTKQQIMQNSDEVMTLLDINAYANKRVEQLSTGMAQKVAIARSLIHKPEVLILDEPTTGLDIMATETFLEIIAMQKALNKIIIFSTHHLDEISAIADRVAVMNNGQMLFHGEVSAFQKHYQTSSLRGAFMNAISKRGQYQLAGHSAMEKGN